MDTSEYIKAQKKVLRIEARLRDLWDEGKYKLRGQIIHDELSSATQKRNKAASRLLSELNQLAEEGLKE